MAEIKPFKGVRYNRQIIDDLSKVVCPPYDVISPEDQIYYHALHPYNYIRLVLGEDFETDTEHENRFTRAARHLNEWLSKGILIQDSEPAIYVYAQEFSLESKKRTVRGFTCAVRLHEYSEGIILPHENTLAKPKTQLIQLMRATRANLDSVYGLYDDEDGTVESILQELTACEPAAEAIDKDGVKHTLWLLTDQSRISTIGASLRDRPIAIADGHHRYETSLAYRKECRSREPVTKELPCDYTLMTLVNVRQDDLTVFPTHRVVKGLAPDILSNFEKELSSLFVIEPSSVHTLLNDMRSRQALGMYVADRAVTLKAKPDSYDLITGSNASRRLELNVLHKLILDRILGIDEEKLRNQTHIYYTRDLDEAIRLVQSGAAQIAFLLNNIDVKSVLDIATAGERMPQKATYFYPKLISGLVARILRDQ
ncbi:MAG: DUF1015 domain-containing protein [Armatimonadota bacterium]